MRSAIEVSHTNKRKMNIFKNQNDNWSHFLVPLSGPTFWSHRPTFRGDLVKIGRESKWEEKSILNGVRSDFLSLRRQAPYALGRGGYMLISGKITFIKVQNDDWSHSFVPLFGPTLLLKPTFSRKTYFCVNFGGVLVG